MNGFLNLVDTGKILSSFGAVSFGEVSFSEVSFSGGSFSVVSFNTGSFSVVSFSFVLFSEVSFNVVSFIVVSFSEVSFSVVSFSIACCSGVYAEVSPATKIKKNIIPLITPHPQFAFKFHQAGGESREGEIGGNPLSAFALSWYRQLPK